MIANLRFSSRQRISVVLSNSLYELSGSALNFVLSILIVRRFSPVLWGAYTQWILLMMFFTMILSWGNKEFLLREFSRSGQLEKIWQTSIQSRAIFFVLLIPAVWWLPVITNPWIFIAWMFATYLLRSFDSVILFERRFATALAVELGGFAILALFLLTADKPMSLELLAGASAAITLVKAVVWMIIFRGRLVSARAGLFDTAYLSRSLPFFLPAFIGFLQSKAATLVAAFALSREEIGTYYLLLSLMSYCHVFAVMAITPFLQNVYRMRHETLKKVKLAFAVAGAGWSVICIVGIFGLLKFIYQVDLPLEYYGVAWLALPPYFVYYLLIQELIRSDKPYSVVRMNAVAAVASFVAGLLLIPPLGFLGGLITSVCMQWLLLAGYLFTTQRALRGAGR